MIYVQLPISCTLPLIYNLPVQLHHGVTDVSQIRLTSTKLTSAPSIDNFLVAATV